METFWIIERRPGSITFLPLYYHVQFINHVILDSISAV